MPQLPTRINGILGAVARVYAMRNRREIVQLLALSRAELELVEHDNWNGGTDVYELQLHTPVHTFLSLADLEKTENELLEALRPLLKTLPNDGLARVSIVLEPHSDENWRDGARSWLSKPAPPLADNKYEFDVFVCHASEDKDLVRPLAQGMRQQGARVWYDEFVIRVGDSLRQTIDKGLVKSKFGIVVLSPAFFKKRWPQYELDGLVTKEIAGRKVILPLWHGVDQAGVARNSPSLAAKAALDTSRAPIDTIVSQLVDVVLDLPGT